LKLLRFRVFKDDIVNPDIPTIYCTNHGQGFWGIVDVLLGVYY